MSRLAPLRRRRTLRVRRLAFAGPWLWQSPAWLRGDMIYATDVGDMESLRTTVPAFADVQILHA